MKETINSPHFYEDSRCDRTFEDLMEWAVGGIRKHNEHPKMHLWLPSSAEQWLVDLVKTMIGDDTGRDNTSAGQTVQ